MKDILKLQKRFFLTIFLSLLIGFFIFGILGYCVESKIFIVTVRGSAWEEWDEEVEVVDDYDPFPNNGMESVWVGSTRKYTLGVEHDWSSESHISKVVLYKGDFDWGKMDYNWTEFVSVSCPSEGWESCKRSKDVFLTWTDVYAWNFTSSNSFAEATLSHKENVRHFDLVENFQSIESSVSYFESPKDVGGFFVLLEPKHGGVLDYYQYELIVDNEEVDVFFSDTGDKITFSDLANILAVVESEDSCLPPVSGDWVIGEDCIFTEEFFLAPANVLVTNNSVLTIANGSALDIDFENFALMVDGGSGVLLDSLGKIY